MLEQTIHQLDAGNMPPELAQETGQLGYMQWLGSLNGAADYLEEAQKALAKSASFSATSPAVRVFCDLLQKSIENPLSPLGLKMPARHRRGGASARRASL